MERKNFPLLLAIVWLLIKSGVKFTGFYEHTVAIGIGLNLVFIPFIVLFAIKPYLREKGHSGIFIAKQGMKSGATYVICVVLGIFLYYNFIDPEYTQNQYAESIRIETEVLSEEGRFEELKKNDPSLRNTTIDEYLEGRKEFYAKLNSPLILSSISLLGLIILTVFYGFFMAILFKVINRN